MTELEKYNQAFTGVFNVEEDALNDGFTFEQVGKWDSIAHMTLITAIEDAYGIMLDTDDILGLTSYETGKEILIKYGVAL